MNVEFKMNDYKIIKQFVNEVSSYRLKTEISEVILNLMLAPDAHVPDTLTRIRVLPGIAVVGQQDKVMRALTGHDRLLIYVKYLPKPGTVYSNLLSLARMVKSLPGVEIVKVQRLNGKKVTFKGRPIVV